MVLTILEWLPPEIISEIIQAASPSDQAALCRISKLFHTLGVPVLYRVVELINYLSITLFCSAILTDTFKFPGLVRSITIELEYQDSRQLQRNSLLSDCLKILHKIEKLSINSRYLDQTRNTVQSCTFPHLLHCALSSGEGSWTSTESENTPASFLIRHPALESIWIQSCHPESEYWPSSTSRIPLLNLKRICAPPDFFLA
ncbi:hypothetical protein B0H19DRAFT_716468 [Mycena capillaripes]|nr:hypothetical protein B0H19DRAFT_716468 [Mycena capillaripes]